MNADPFRSPGLPSRALFLSALLSGSLLPALAEVPRLLIHPGAPATSTLIWENGEQLNGELTGADAEQISWKSPLFATPVRLQRSVLRRLEFAGGFTPAAESFRLVLSGGSHLTGELESIEGDAITFSSPLCGRITVKRDQVVCIERLKGAGIIAAGPQALVRPDAGKAGAGVSPESSLLLAAAGRVATPSFNLSNLRELALPERCLVDIILSTSGAPGFALKLSDGISWVALETWQDELVLVTGGDQFISTGVRFEEKDAAIHLRLAWDRPAGRCALYGPDGKLRAGLTKAKPEEKVPSDPNAENRKWLKNLFGVRDTPPPSASGAAVPGKGITLHNKGAGLMVERFSLTAWSGEAPPELPAGVPSVDAGTTVIAGDPVALQGDVLKVRMADGSLRETAFSEVRALRWPRRPEMERLPEAADLWFANGSLLRGKMSAVRDGKAVVETDFTTAPVEADLSRGHTLLLPASRKRANAASTLAKMDVLSAGDVHLHGSIEAADGVLPKFLPVGALEAVEAVDTEGLGMKRGASAGDIFTLAPALLHLKTGDTIPVTMRSITRDRVAFAWDAAEIHELKTSDLHAVQFAPPAAGGGSFDGHGWQAAGGAVSRFTGGAQLPPGAAIANPWLLQGNGFRFRMKSDGGLATLRFRLFCQGADRGSDSVNFIAGHFGSDVYCGVERGEGQLENQISVPSSQEAVIEFKFPGDQVEMYVNGQSAGRTSARKPSAKKTGTGMVIETASLWGNREGTVIISGLETESSPCMPGPPAFTSEAKRDALLIPRLRRDDPPRHVLIGRNGDLLRGEIESMTSSHLMFRTGLETFKVPVDRVSAAVWVVRPPKPGTAGKETSAAENPGEAVLTAAAPATAKKTAPAPGTVQWLDLTNGGRIRLKVQSWGKEKVTGTHALLGRCTLPVKSVFSFSPRDPGPAIALSVLADWKLENTPDPVLPGDDGGGTASPLAGKPAAAFSLPDLDDKTIALADLKGKVVVLDFWATWCGPCVKSLPPLIAAMQEFPADKAVFIGVNQGDTKEQVRRFLDARKLSMPVALDKDLKVAKDYGVDGIPHTVVIDPQGQIAFVKTGYEPDGEKKIAEAVRKAMGTAPPAGAGGEGEPSARPPAETGKSSGDASPVEKGETLLPPPDLD